MPIVRLFLIVSHLMTRDWQRIGEGAGPSGPGLGVLLDLLQYDGSPHSAVARRCWVTPATLSGVVDTLERDGLVERRRDAKDRRVVRLYLTEQGRAACADVRRLGLLGPTMVHFREQVAADPDFEARMREFLIDIIVRAGEEQST